MKPPRCAEAIELYVAQMSTGEATAVPSLQRAAAKALTTSDGDLARVAANVTARRVVTAYLISRGGPWMDSPAPDAQRKWLAAFEEAKAGLAEEADRFALAAYQAGEMDVAKRWLKLAPQDAPMTRWVRAKLLLRDGKLAEAAEHLAFVARRLPEAKACKQVCKYSDEIYRRSEKYYDPAYETYLAGVPQERLRGELGSLLLSRGQYGEALGTLLAGGFWLDAAYVAECVMTPDELQAFVDANCPPPGSSWEGPSENGGTDIPVCPITDRQECLSHHAMVKDVSWGRVAAAKPGDDPAWYRGPLRHLLARRLARLGRFDEARAYYPAKLQPRLDAYVEALREGNDARVAKEKRAEALWQAACVARRDGMSLLGTELAPDAFIHDGSYECVEQRNPQGDPARSRLVPASADEIERARRHRVEPFVRFHYRYVAADLAWRAAALMPAESDETARVLCEAGSWLKKRDPKAADRFYKALVRRCGTTSLGRQADALRWFPLLAPPVAARAE
jgi:tetratricopeptide (TPR) repeat protein